MVATDETMVVNRSLFDAIVMEDGQSDRGLSDPAGTNEGDRCEVFRQANDFLDQLATSEIGSRQQQRRRG